MDADFAPDDSPAGPLRPAVKKSTLPYRLIIILILVGICAQFAIVYALKAINNLEPLGQGNELSEWEGQPLPDVAVRLLDGKNQQTADLHGKVAVLNFWATWCPPCRQELPHFNRLAREMKGDVAFLGISDEDPDKVRRFVMSQALTYPIGTLAKPVAPFDEISSIPVTFVVDPGGIIRKVHVGYCSYEELKSFVAAARAQ